MRAGAPSSSSALPSERSSSGAGVHPGAEIDRRGPEHHAPVYLRHGIVARAGLDDEVAVDRGGVQSHGVGPRPEDEGGILLQFRALAAHRIVALLALHGDIAVDRAVALHGED